MTSAKERLITYVDFRLRQLNMLNEDIDVTIGDTQKDMHKNSHKPGPPRCVIYMSEIYRNIGYDLDVQEIAACIVEHYGVLGYHIAVPKGNDYVVITKTISCSLI